LVVDGSEALQTIAAPDPPLTGDVAAPDALRLIARACIAQIKAHRGGLHARSPEALHQVRVALRRWRTAMTVFSEILTDEGRRLKAELKWLAGELNEARDLDVFAPSLEARKASGDADATGLAALAAALDQAQARAYQRAERALRSERASRVLWEGGRPLRGSALTLEGEAPSARDLAARALAHRRRQLMRRGPRLDRLDPESRHRLRIRAKKARYAAELFGDLFGHEERRRRMIRALKDIQDRLGELNDIHVGQALAADLAREAGVAEAGFEAGLIAGARAGRRKRLIALAGKAYRRFAGVSRFW
jgi:CHAD domain-containing protein